MNEIFLSICIPTYNRATSLYSLLSFLDNENIRTYNEIEIIVGNNASTDETDTIVAQSPIQQFTRFMYIKNQKNLGIVGNLISLSQKARGKYIWFMGDDDNYKAGIINKVYQNLKEISPAICFINHSAYGKDRSPGIGFDSAVDIEKPSYYEDGKIGIRDIWKKSKTSLMFISAGVFDKEILLGYIREQRKFDLSLPLRFSFYSASRGSLFIIKDIFIDNVWGDISWSEKQQEMFYKLVPKTILSMLSMQYKFTTVILILFSYSKKRWKGFLKYFLLPAVK